jgi:hypothetical protein
MATGTYAIGVEARRTDTVLAGTTKQQSITYGAPNKVVYFSVDGSAVAPRRQVVAVSNCNQCHVNLSVHGSLRNNPEYCVMCHNPSNTDASVRGSAQVAADKNAPAQGIDFSLLVHRVHDGVSMAADGGSYTVVGFGGSHNDFSTTLFPAMSPNGKATDLANCSLCHVKGSEANLPEGLNNVVNPQGWMNPEGATATACSGCHVAKDAAAHFSANTSPYLGESCTSVIRQALCSMWRKFMRSIRRVLHDKASWNQTQAVSALAFIFLSVAGPPVCGYAQSSARSVRGIVTDRDGAPLPSSVVEIEDTATLRIRSFIAGNDGAYYFMGLSPDGDYKLRARYRNVWGRAKALSRFDSRQEATVNLKIDVLKEE